MLDESRIQLLLEEMLDSNCTPDQVCRDYPELLPEVQNRWLKLQRINDQLNDIFDVPEVAVDFEGAATRRLEFRMPQIEGYDVEGVLGSGGMGVVYRARHLKLDRLVALKMMLAGTFAGTQQVARFLREARSIAGLRHAHIVQVYDVAELDGQPYFTMEFVEGGTLADQLHGAPQTAIHAASAIATLADAIGFAHEQGIVHRDLKPANILRTAEGTLKVADFGVARLMEAGPELTATGARIGTPSYMAPEQAAGLSHLIGPSVDIYSLGAILYEMLTGRPPFRAETAIETERQVITEDVVPPSHLNASIPRDLETICLKCLHKLPDRRYATAAAFADDLRRFLGGSPIQARRVGAVERVTKWIRRRPSTTMLIAALVALIVTVVGSGITMRQQEVRRQDDAKLRQGRARQAIETSLGAAVDLMRNEHWLEAEHIVSDAATRVGEANSLELQMRVHHTQSDIRLAQRLERARQDRRMPVGDQITLDRAFQIYAAEFDRAGLNIEGNTAEIAARIRSSGIREQLVIALDEWAIDIYLLPDKTRANRLLEIARLADPDPAWRDQFRTLAAWEDRHTLHRLADEISLTSPPLVQHLASLGILLERAGERAAGREIFREAQQNRPGDFWLNFELGSSLFGDEKSAAAIPYLRAAFALRPDNYAAANVLGNALEKTGEIDEAVAIYRRVVALYPSINILRGNLVRALAKSGRWDEAKSECLRSLADDAATIPQAFIALEGMLWNNSRRTDAIDIDRKMVAIEPKNAAVAANLALHLWASGQSEEAVAEYRRAIELDPKLVMPYFHLGFVLRDLKRSREAIDAFQAAADLNCPEHSVLRELGTLLREDGQYDRAIEVFKGALARDSDSQANWDGLADSYLAQGRFEDARSVRLMRFARLVGDKTGQNSCSRQIEFCDRLIALKNQLPALLAGTEQIEDVSALICLAEWCERHCRRPAEAVRFYTAAFAAQPPLMEDLNARYRFRAAVAAAKSTRSGDGTISVNTAQERRALHSRVLAWLKADRDAWVTRYNSRAAKEKTQVAGVFREWIGNEGLSFFCSADSLSELPDEQRREWQSLWEDVNTFAARDPVLILQQARQFACRKEWQRAVDAYGKFFQLDPTNDGEIWFEVAAVQLLAGDRDAYRRTCDEMLRRGSLSILGMRQYHVARACTLAPDAVNEWNVVIQQSSPELQSSASQFWSLTQQAALSIRGNKSEEGERLLIKSLETDQRRGTEVVNWLWLAVAWNRLGDNDAALRWFIKARTWIDQLGGELYPNAVASGLHLHNWLEAHVLLHEMEAQLAPKRPTDGTIHLGY